MHPQDDHFFKQVQGLSVLVSHSQDHHTNYYNEYCRLYLANFVLTSQMKQIIKEKKSLEERLYRLEEKHYDDFCSDTLQRNKRHRRTANQISRYHKCSVSTCMKSYGSEGSLNQHLKLKHPELVIKNQQEESQSPEKPQLQKENMSHNTIQKSLKKK